MFRIARALARLARAASRRLGRTGGTTAPGRALLSVSPRALERMSARARRRVRARVGHQRQDHHRRDDRRGARARRARRSCTTAPGRTWRWGVATALLDAGRERGQLGLFEVDEAWLPAVARDTDPRLLLLSNLFRDQLDRYGELELLADRWAELTAELDGRARFVLNADDPLVADLGRERSGVTYFGVEDDSQALPGMQHAADSKHCRNCGHAYEYDAVYLGHMGRYHCPNCGRSAAGAADRRHQSHSRRHEGIARRAPHPARRARGPPAPPRALQRLQRGCRSGDRARARRAARDGARGARGLRRRLRARRDHPRGRPARLDPADQEPRRRERGAADAHARGRPARPLDGPQRPHRRRPRRLLDLGRRLRGAGRPRAARDLQRHPRGGDGAAPEVRRDRRRARRWTATSATRSTPPWRTPPAERVYALPTYTALLELRDLLADRGLAKRWSE